MRPLGIHHVNLTVGNLSEAMSFYVDQLGLTERTDRPNFSFDGAWLDLGAQQVHLVVGERGPNNFDHFAVHVDNIDEAVHELREHGHQVSDPKQSGTARQCFLRDPWGNFLELHQPAREQHSPVLDPSTAELILRLLSPEPRARELAAEEIKDGGWRQDDELLIGRVLVRAALAETVESVLEAQLNALGGDDRGSFGRPGFQYGAEVEELIHRVQSASESIQEHVDHLRELATDFRT